MQAQHAPSETTRLCARDGVIGIMKSRTKPEIADGISRHGTSPNLLDFLQQMLSGFCT